MRKMLLSICCLISVAGYSQQLALQNMYFFDLIYANAAYTGHSESLNVSSILRQQWVGFDGGPETYALAVHSPLKNQNMGVGLQASYDRIGPRAVTSIAGSYAYRIRIGNESKLSFGLRVAAENHQYNFDEIDYRDETDVIQNQGSSSIWAPAFDFAVLATGERYFIGVEANNLSHSKLRDVEFSEARQFLHGRLVAGYLFKISEKFTLKPNLMMRYASNAPLQMDLNLNGLIIERFWLGVGYRHQYGFLAMLQFRITDQLEVGYSYDFATNPLRAQHSGSHELFLSYRFNLFKANFSSPRYF